MTRDDDDRSCVCRPPFGAKELQTRPRIGRDDPKARPRPIPVSLVLRPA